MNDKQIWLAPMMGWTNGWFRSLIQALHPKVWLVTEMVTAEALFHTTVHAKKHNYFWRHPLEQNTILQIAASNPEQIHKIGALLAASQFQHINLNAGCPSKAVSGGSMGASLMLHPQLTYDILSSLQTYVPVVSIKCRLGVNNQPDEALDKWMKAVSETKCDLVILHARQALLNVNTVQNRSIPPLRYERVLEFAKEWSKLQVILNGGLNTLELINKWRSEPLLLGVMLGRIAYQQPWLFWELAKEDNCANHTNILAWFETIKSATWNPNIIRTLLALTKGLRHAKCWREQITKGQIQIIPKLIDECAKHYW